MSSAKRNTSKPIRFMVNQTKFTSLLAAGTANTCTPHFGLKNFIYRKNSMFGASVTTDLSGLTRVPNHEKVAILKNDLKQSVSRFYRHRYNGKQYKFNYNQAQGFSLADTGSWSCQVLTLNEQKRPVYLVQNISVYQRTDDGETNQLVCPKNYQECKADCGRNGICCEHKVTLVKSCQCER